MRPWGWFLIQPDWQPDKKRTFGHSDTPAMHTQRKGTARERPSASQGERLQEKTILLTLWLLTYNFQECDKTNFLVKPPSSCILLWQPQPITPTRTRTLNITGRFKTSLCLTLEKLIFATADSPYTGTLKHLESGVKILYTKIYSA